jgi:hypothetical protein
LARQTKLILKLLSCFGEQQLNRFVEPAVEKVFIFRLMVFFKPRLDSSQSAAIVGALMAFRCDHQYPPFTGFDQACHAGVGRGQIPGNVSTGLPAFLRNPWPDFTAGRLQAARWRVPARARQRARRGVGRDSAP